MYLRTVFRLCDTCIDKTPAGGFSRVNAECLWKFHDIGGHEHGRAVHRTLNHPGRVIPAEFRKRGIPHFPHYRLLTFIQRIEADEDELVRTRKGRFQYVTGAFSLQTFHERAVNHALVGFAFFCQCRIERGVKRIEQVPYHEEALFHIGILGADIDREFSSFTEMRYEIPYGFFLSLRQISIVILYLLEVGDIGEQLFRRGQILVRIIEVAEDDVPPEDEVVQ